MNLVGERRAYNSAGALAEELPYWGYLPDDRTCLTRSGELLSIGRLRPTVLDGRTPAQLDTTLQRWTRMLSTIEPGGRVAFFLVRVPASFEADADDSGEGVSALSRRRRKAFLLDRVQDIHVFIVWSHNPGLKQSDSANGSGPWWLQYAKAWLRRRKAPNESNYLASQVTLAADRFRQMVDASRAMVDDLTPIVLLNGNDGGRMLSLLINRPGLPWDGATGSGMNWRLAVSELDAERRFLRLDGEPVIIYSLLSPPGAARANLLNDLYRIDARMTISMEWQPWAIDAGRKKIRSAQKHYFSKRYSMMSHVQETEGTSVAMEDSAAAAESGRLSNALVELETEGIAYGTVSLSVSLHGELDETERRDADIRRIFALHDAKVIREGYGQLATWFSRLPGQPPARQLRKVFISAGAAACLAPIFGPPQGSQRSTHLNAPCLTIFETHWNTPYYYDLFAGDVGHTLVLGATGAGKSFMLNFLLVQALQYNPRVLILDLGGSYRWLTRFLGGGYMELSPDDAGSAGQFRLRPFSPFPEGNGRFNSLPVGSLVLCGWADTS